MDLLIRGKIKKEIKNAIVDALIFSSQKQYLRNYLVGYYFKTFADWDDILASVMFDDETKCITFYDEKDNERFRFDLMRTDSKWVISRMVNDIYSYLK